MERFPNNHAKNCDRVTATYEQSSDASEAGWAIGPSGVMGLRPDRDRGEVKLEGQRKGLAARD